MKTDELKLRLSPAEKKAFQDAAGVAGISVSAWMRERLRTAARHDLEDAGLQIPFIEDLRRQNGG